MRREHIRRQHGLVRGSGETRPQQRARQVNPLKHRGLGPYRSRAGGDLAIAQSAFRREGSRKILEATARHGRSRCNPHGRRPRGASQIETSEELSLVDRTSIAFMERSKITRAATFNPKFAEHRYGRDLKNRFHIIRAGHSQAFRTLREAILQRRPVRLSYGGTQQTACPYIVGHAGGEERAFALALDGARQGNKSGQSGWICLRVANVREVEILDQPWKEQAYPGRVQRCVDQVHLDVTRLSGVNS